MTFTPSSLIYSKRTRDRGHGVFARDHIPEGTVIEQVPVIVLPVEDVWSQDATQTLSKYVFHWREGYVALALGFGSLYNHSYEPNASCEDVTPRSKRFVAIRDIRPDEEITFNYAGDVDARDDVGFQVR